MNERQKRLIEVYEHLRQNFGVHTKTQFAECVNFGRTSMSAALNGKEEYLTDSLFKTICESYPDVFNLDYLLNGRGALLAEQKKAAEPPNDPTADLVDLCARVIKEVEYLRKQLTEEIAEVHTLRLELSATLHQLRGQYQSPNIPTASAAETTIK